MEYSLHPLSLKFIRLLRITLKDLEASLANAITAWNPREKLKIAPLAREFGIPYHLLSPG